MKSQFSLKQAIINFNIIWEDIFGQSTGIKTFVAYVIGMIMGTWICYFVAINAMGKGIRKGIEENLPVVIERCVKKTLEYKEVKTKPAIKCTLEQERTVGCQNLQKDNNGK